MKRIIHQTIRRVTEPATLVAIGIIVLCLMLQGAGLDQTLRFDRNAIDAGNYWLLLSGNFVHLGNSHLLMNLAGFVLVVSLVWTRFNWIEWVLITLFSSVVVGVGLYLLDKNIIWYVGFSGTLHGLVLAGCLADLRYYPKSAGVLLVLIVGKLGWEQYAGALPGSESVAGGNVVVNSHLYGAIGGAFLAVVLLAVKHVQRASYKAKIKSE